MADKTRAQMITVVLQRLGVLGVGQTADANDSTRVGEVFDSVRDQLRVKGLVPFAADATPTWAQEPLAKCVAAEAGPYFGRIDLGPWAAMGEAELFRQVAGFKHNLPIVTDYF